MISSFYKVLKCLFVFFLTKCFWAVSFPPIGAGFGICYVPCIVAVGLYFDKYRNLAFGIVNTAMSLGVVVTPYLIQASMEEYGWRGCMLILSGMTLHLCISAAVFRPVSRSYVAHVAETLVKSCDSLARSNLALEMTASIDQGLDLRSRSRETRQFQGKLNVRTGGPVKLLPPKAAPVSEGEDQIQCFRMTVPISSQTKELLLSKRFHILSVSLVFINTANFMPYVHFPAYATVSGATMSHVTNLVSITGVCGVCSRLIGGALTNSKRVNVVVVYLSACVLCALLIFSCPLLIGTTPGQITFAAAFGCVGNWCNSLLAPLIVELFSLELLSPALGIQCLMIGVGMLLGPPIAG